VSLDPPTLDDRTFDDLLADARKLLPAYTDEWTDHNVHDPGITVLELLAWLTETYGFQLDQLTDEHVRKYLRLVGETPTPPRSARVDLSLSPTAAADGTVLPRGTTVLTDDAGTTVGFETARSVAVTDADLAHVVTDHRRGRTDNTTANGDPTMHFLGFGPLAERGATLNLGFAGDPFAGDAVDLAVDFHDDDLPPVGAHRDEPSTFQPTVELGWEYLTDASRWFDDDAWAPLSLATDDAGEPLDTTDRLYRGGYVRLAAPDPADWAAVDRTARVFDAPAGRYWLRCRVTSGGYEIPPAFDAVRVNGVPAVQQTTVGPVDPATDDAVVLVRAERRLAETGREGFPGDADRPRPSDETRTTDLPGQVFLLPDAPVLAATIHVREPGGSPAEWTEVVDLDASGPSDSHYVREPTTGVIRFGDGVTGRVPPAGSEVLASEYVVGGGETTVSAGARWSLATDALGDEIAVSVPSAVTGGADAESGDEALVRVRRGLLATSRAVTPADYRELARSTPGVRVARATATTETVPGPGDCDPVTAVRVVVVPHSTLPESTPPEPSPGLLDAVDAHLQRHRLLTDRVSVARPISVGVGVAVGVELAEGFTAEGRITAVADALDAFLDPLTGFDGDGWPFGRPVYRAELYEQIVAVPGVDCVRDLSASADGGRVTDAGTVVLAPTELAYSAGHDVTVLTDDADCRRRR
jgi:predicted phage baseplate assembly protein